MKEFDPLEYENLTIHVVNELMSRDAVPLDSIVPFRGAGVYALFYDGDLEYYQEVRSPDASIPIYVGKAVPPGGRKGLNLAQSVASRDLSNRLREHSKSIETVSNLAPSEFSVRYLVVKPLWISMTERFLISNFQPIWNSCVDGFGNHDPGVNRPGKRSRWDTLHPGRVETWRADVIEGDSEDEVLHALKVFLCLPRD